MRRARVEVEAGGVAGLAQGKSRHRDHADQDHAGVFI